jgi:hypothetical protein
MSDNATHRMSWRCTECSWGVSSPARARDYGQWLGTIITADDHDVVGEVLLKHLSKHNFLGDMNTETIDLDGGHWEDY